MIIPDNRGRAGTAPGWAALFAVPLVMVAHGVNSRLHRHPRSECTHGSLLASMQHTARWSVEGSKWPKPGIRNAALSSHHSTIMHTYLALLADGYCL